MNATIKVVREKDFLDLSKIKIFLDGKKVGKIAKDSVMSFDVAAGSHVVYVKQNWFKSAKLTVLLKEGECKFLAANISNTGKGTRTGGIFFIFALATLLYLTFFGRSKYFDFKEVKY